MPDITITAADGGSFSAYLATPASGSGPGLVVIQEILGVNQNMRDLCDGYAADGYMACCPDLFWRQEPGIQLAGTSQEDWDKAFALMGGFNFETGVGDLIAAMGHLRGLDGASGKVGAVGYCMGGSLAYFMACQSDVDAAAGYYPVQIDDKLDYAAGISSPTVLHIGEADGFCPPEAQAKIKDGLAGNGNITVHSYQGADHAFARIGGDAYNADAANLANQRSMELFNTNLK